MPGDHSDDRLGFLTVSDNIFVVGGSAGGVEQAGRPQPQSGLLEGARGGTENCMAASFTEALRC